MVACALKSLRRVRENNIVALMNMDASKISQKGKKSQLLDLSYSPFKPGVCSNHFTFKKNCVLAFYFYPTSETKTDCAKTI